MPAGADADAEAVDLPSAAQNTSLPLRYPRAPHITFGADALDLPEMGHETPDTTPPPPEFHITMHYFTFSCHLSKAVYNHAI